MGEDDPGRGREGRAPEGGGGRGGGRADRASGGEGAPLLADPFDLWLRGALRRLYGPVLAEPIPDELLRLIEDDRARPPARAPGAVRR